MKNLLFLLLVLVYSASFSQTTQSSTTQTLEVYSTTNGFTEITPSQVVETTYNTVKVYNTTNGIKEIVPIKVIVIENNVVKEYNTTNGFKDIEPSKVYIWKRD